MRHRYHQIISTIRNRYFGLGQEVLRPVSYRMTIFYYFIPNLEPIFNRSLAHVNNLSKPAYCSPSVLVPGKCHCLDWPG